MNENRQDLSIIVPVYNVERYLSRCIESLRKQTYSNINIILVDDGSTDKSAKICDYYAKIDSRIYVIHKKNGGLSSARNEGLLHCNTEYVGFVDSDDWITLDMYEHLIMLAKEKKADIVSCTYKLTYDEKDIIDKSSNSYDICTMDSQQALQYYLDSGMKDLVSDYPAWTKIYKTDLFKTIAFPVGKLYEDYATNIRLIKKCKCYVKSNKICYYYFQTHNSIVHSAYKIKDNDLIEQSKIVCELVKDQNQIIRKIAKEKYARSYFSLACKMSLYGFDNSVKEDERKKILKEFQKKIRLNFCPLLFSSMPISRKIILGIMFFDMRILKIFRIYRRFEK